MILNPTNCFPYVHFNIVHYCILAIYTISSIIINSHQLGSEFFHWSYNLEKLPFHALQGSTSASGSVMPRGCTNHDWHNAKELKIFANFENYLLILQVYLKFEKKSKSKYGYQIIDQTAN
jgi:hypothetical protein